MIKIYRWRVATIFCVALFTLMGSSSSIAQGADVGELQEQWQFPSDHLPIGISLGDLHIVSWNILDSQYIDWVIEKNSQGLSRSLIATEHAILEKNGMTCRENHIITIILEMIAQEGCPKSLICLQECSGPCIQSLCERLPEEWSIVVDFSGEAILFDTNQLQLIELDIVDGVFSAQLFRSFLDVVFAVVGEEQYLRVINTHLPGDPQGPARFEFAEYIATTFVSNQPLLITGDMNFNEIEMDDAMNRAFDHDSPLIRYSPYCTNIGPQGPGQFQWRSKAIDHFFVYAPGLQVKPLSAADVWFGLRSTVELLNPSWAMQYEESAQSVIENVAP